MERALFKKEREMQELLRQADKENARLEVLLEQAREQLKKENIDKEFEWIVKRYFAVQAGHRFKSAEMLECV